MSAVDTLVEPVAWRVRAYPGHTWQIVERIPPNFPQDWEKEPLIPATTIAALQAEVERANEALDTIARGRIGPVSCLGGALAAMQSFAREACRLPAARSASRKENTP